MFLMESLLDLQTQELETREVSKDEKQGRRGKGEGAARVERRADLTGPHPVLSEFPLGLRSRPLPAAQLLSSTHPPCPCSTRPASLCP